MATSQFGSSTPWAKASASSSKKTVAAKTAAKKAAAKTMSVKDLNESYSKEFGKAGNAKIDYYIDKGLTTREEMDRLRADIAKNGVKEPLMMDSVRGKNVLLNGHHRLAIANELGLKTLPISGLNSVAGILGLFQTLNQGGKAFTAKKPTPQEY